MIFDNLSHDLLGINIACCVFIKQKVTIGNYTTMNKNLNFNVWANNSRNIRDDLVKALKKLRTTQLVK